ncbi:MAG: YfhO family protein [Oscillospiraceae bacterium]
MKKANKPNGRTKAANIKKLCSLIIPPLFVFCYMLFNYKQNDMYPFGTKTMSWCDMSQQVVPLLNQFKDILEGKDSLFLSFKNSGGMNLYGVFFFFLASPFTFLVKFVAKENMMMFANILVALKMSYCAFTAALCICDTRKKLDCPSVIFLSVLYPFCGYTMMYYQNIIWLDMMYLFPLLIMSFYRITKKQNPVMYILVLSAMVTVNYYISYMIVVFILLFVGVYTLRNLKSSYCSRICREFFIGSLIAALLTTVVWLPSLIQYVSSGRGETGMFDSLAASYFVASYQTTIPMLFCSAFLFVILLCDIVSKRERSDRNKRLLALLGITLIPFIVEPINKMWHTGNYMSFPCRFGFIPIFLAILCAAYALENNFDYKNKLFLYLFSGLVSLGTIYCCYRFVTITRKNNIDPISKYSRTLWGDDTSFKLLLGIFVMFIIAYAVIYASYKKGFIFKNIFLFLSAAVFLIESWNYSAIYMVHPAENNEKTNEYQSEVYDLENRIDDGDFYRVKSYSKLYNNNMIGALGYNSIGHYTSLNSRDYMFTMKRIGYSGVWMETASVGGTRLTDALLSIKYEINGGVDGCEQIYQSDAGSIYRLPDYLPMGLLLEKGALDKCAEIPKELTRTQVQQYLSESIFGESVITEHEPLNGIEQHMGRTYLEKGDSVYFNVKTNGRTTVYLDCFDELTNHLSEPIFDSLSVNVNGEIVDSSYPSATNNGVLRLGDYCGEELNICVTVLKDIECGSFGIFSLDSDRLAELCGTAEGAYLNVDGNGLSGSCKTDSAKTCFVSVPYDSNFKIKVNGKETEYKKAFSDFICFDVPKGENEIKITYIPKGFTAGVIVSVIGAAAFAAYLFLRKKLNRSIKIDTALKYTMLTVSALVFFAVYIMPLIVNIFSMELE